MSSMNYPPTTVHQTRFDLDVELNPFERSFQSPVGLRVAPNSPHPGGNNERQTISPKQSGASIFSSLLADQTYQWPLLSATSFTNSLNAGPLNPAMLSAPQDKYDHISFDPTSFFTGFSPRSGITPHGELPTTKDTLLLPLSGGPFAFPSPTTALLELMHGRIEESGSSPSETPTLNNLCAHPSALGSTSTSDDSLSSDLDQPPRLRDSHTEDVVESDHPPSTTALSNTTIANGLFLLTQANEELKRMEHVSKKNEVQTSTDETKGTKRKVHDAELQPDQPRQRPGIKARVISRSLSRNEGSEDEIEKQEALQSESRDGRQYGGRRRTRRKPLTEEEKRKDFLERNRIAASKCRQRKKVWQADLEAKIEYLIGENERLMHALVASREELSRLSAVLGSRAVVGGANL